MRVGFFLENGDYKDIDFSRPMEGNPGIRGTQYMIWTIAYFLNKNYPDIETVLFAPVIEKMPSDLLCVESNSDLEALKMAPEYNVDIMVLRTYTENTEYYEYIEKCGIKCIMWSHNFENYRRAQAIYNTNAIKRNVCVGRQQYERLRDHPVFSKSVCIYNTLDFENYSKYPERGSRPIVTYVGALNSMKGFHILAHAWPKVLKKVPDAELFVIGSGSLGANVKLGPHNLAVAAYEEKFVNYLCDNNGEILSSVHFMGNMGGEEKKKIMGMSRVGVANPTGKGETFCIVAIEFQALGVPVVSAKKNGTLDTVEDGETGLLVSDSHQLADAIITLLEDPKTAKELGDKGFEQSRIHFSIENICDQWYRLLLDVQNDIPQEVDYTYSYPKNQAKFLRELNRKFQKTAIGKRSPSILKYETAIRDIIRHK